MFLRCMVIYQKGILDNPIDSLKRGWGVVGLENIKVNMAVKRN